MPIASTIVDLVPRSYLRSSMLLAKTSTSGIEGAHLLLFVRDVHASLGLLVDTGAEVSLLPTSHKDKCLTSSRTLEAVNGSSINAYSECPFTLSFGGEPSKHYPWVILVAHGRGAQGWRPGGSPPAAAFQGRLLPPPPTLFLQHLP